ncbi:MAG: GNAT family N-acetyltransferase [Pseudomonadota bacterium]
MRIIEHTLTSLESVAAQWTDLSARADSPSLFNSWDWCHSWLESLDQDFRDQITVRLFVATGASDQWLALAPCFTARIRRSGVPFNCLQFMGGGFGVNTIYRTEFNEALYDRSVARSELDEFYDAVFGSEGWDKLVLADVINPALNSTIESQTQYRVRELETDSAYCADLSSGFDAYLKALSGSSRRQLFNKRKRLSEMGTVEVEQVTLNDWNGFVETLNEFFRHRWNIKKMLSNQRQEFLTRLCERASINDPKFAGSLLKLDGRAISGLVDLDYAGKRYNLMAGITPDAPAGVSPGLLHFGYSLEQAAAQGITTYEFLIGKGKNENYKKNIANRELPARTVGLVRSRWLRAVYAANDAMKRIF